MDKEDVIYVCVCVCVCVCVMEYYSAIKKNKNIFCYLQQDGWTWRELC